MAFDKVNGRLRCEAGVLLGDIFELCLPHGWFVPVTPGTQLITVGGAIANDVHGKNHHRAGSFGRHITCFELLRSDGRRRFCSPTENREWFEATVGGLGLTGVITWAEIQLTAVQSAYFDNETIRYPGLSDFFRLARDSDATFDYTVAWVDCMARGQSLGRGVFSRANHATCVRGREDGRVRHSSLRVPFVPPVSLINPLTMKLANTFYYYFPRRLEVQRPVHYQPFLYPLDVIADWNRVYGRRGFLQYQCVIPPDDAESVIREILERVVFAGGSSLGVMKLFGELPGPGLLSFSRPGVTLAMDFANRGATTLELLDDLDALTLTAGGAVNPSKDARMSPGSFQTAFGNWRKLLPYVDPRCSSSFWRRVTKGAS